MRHQSLNPRNVLRVAYFEKVLRNLEVHGRIWSGNCQELERERKGKSRGQRYVGPRDL